MCRGLVRDLPDDVHEALLRRAEAAGPSLQQYLTNELGRLASRPTLDDLIARIEARSGGRVGLDQAVADLEDTRGR